MITVISEFNISITCVYSAIINRHPNVFRPKMLYIYT